MTKEIEAVGRKNACRGNRVFQKAVPMEMEKEMLVVVHGWKINLGCGLGKV